MLQKELAKCLKARYDTKMDGNGWLEVSSDGITLTSGAGGFGGNTGLTTSPCP